MVNSTDEDRSAFAIARDQLNAQLWSLILALVAVSLVAIIFSFSANKTIEISRASLKLGLKRDTVALGLAVLISLLALLHVIVVSLTMGEWRRQIKNVREQRGTRDVGDLQDKLGRVAGLDEGPSKPQIEGRAGGWILVLLILLVPLSLAIVALWRIVPEVT